MAPGHARVNRGCWEAFGAVYDCEVPVIAAVHGFCLGGGVGLAGNTDIVVASAKAYINAVNKLHSKTEKLNPQV